MSVFKYRNNSNKRGGLPGLTALDRKRREERDKRDFSSKLRKKIYSTGNNKESGPPITFYTFDAGIPAGGEEISLTFTMPFGKRINLNLGDGNEIDNIKGGQTVNHTYS